MIQVIDKGDYFRVVWGGIESSTYVKHPDGFATAEELAKYLANNDADAPARS